MVAITLRADLSRGLTNAEIDANMTALKTAVEAAALSAQWASITGKPTTLAGYGITDAQAPLVSGTNIKTVNNQSVLGSGDLALATASHKHDATYLGKTAKAADSELLDGFNSTAFLRSVNGSGPDGNGNVAVNVDLSSRVAKTGDTMTGTLTIENTAPTIVLRDTDNGVTKQIHHNSDLIGFLSNDGGWLMHGNNGGQIWSRNYGWLHDYFFSTVSNCGYVAKAGNISQPTIGNCHSLGDGGSNISLTGTITLTANCNCQCNC